MNIFGAKKPETEGAEPFRRRRILKAIAGMVALVLMIVGVYAFLSSSAFAIRGVAVSGNRHLTKEDVLSIMKIRGGENLVFISLEELFERFDLILPVGPGLEPPAVDDVFLFAVPGFGPEPDGHLAQVILEAARGGGAPVDLELEHGSVEVRAHWKMTA